VKEILNSAFARPERVGSSQHDGADVSIPPIEASLPATPVWLWDHYRYNPQQNSTQKQSNQESTDKSRNLLIAQVIAAPHSPEWRTSLFQFGEISSRPNRAYARQWGRNFVRYTAPPEDDDDFDSSNSQQCDGVDHVVVLNAILDRQQPRTREPFDTMPYDALVLLPPDAIITDLDYDLLSMIPKDKLVSVVGSRKEQRHLGGVVFWNLRHELTHVVAEHLWKELVKPREDEGDRPPPCESKQSYIDLLLENLLPSILKDDEDAQSVVGNLDETKDGFVFVGAPSLSSSEIDATGKSGDAVPSFCLKCFPPTGSSSKTSQFLSDPDATRVTLERTADAVCYRYYPKCEVL